jgi:uncharacterized protein (DUF302 family)
MTNTRASGIVGRASHLSFDDTVERLIVAITS